MSEPEGHAMSSGTTSARPCMTKILIPHHSLYGHIEAALLAIV